MRSVKGWPIVSVAILAVALALAGCGGGGDDDSNTPAPSAITTPPPNQPGALETRGALVNVAGRTLAGQCVGHQTDAPTMLLEVGMGAPQQALRAIGDPFIDQTMVCAYARAGMGNSTPASKPRPVAEVVSDLHAFLSGAAKPPYFLIGQSFGAEVVFLYAQAHPGQVAGFVSINPSPPYQTWLKRARTVQTEAEIQEFELPFPQGENDEGIDTRSDESMLTDPLPADLPYAVLFDATCEELPPPLQNQKDCTRMVSLLELTAKDLANVGKGGRYVRVKGAGHDMQMTQPDLVIKHVDQVWKEALNR